MTTVSTTTIDRMNLSQLLRALKKRNLNQTASYFSGYAGDENYTVDTVWIDKSFVKRHIGYGQLLKDLECEVITWTPY
jgi:hypothetical protein